MFGKHFSLSFSSTQLSHLLSFVFSYAPNQPLAAAILIYVFFLLYSFLCAFIWFIFYIFLSDSSDDDEVYDMMYAACEKNSPFFDDLFVRH